MSTKSKFALHPYQSTNSKLGNLNAAKGKYLKRIPPSGLDVGLRREERKKLLSNEGERNLRSSRARTFRHSASLSHMPLPSSFSSAERERERETNRSRENGRGSHRGGGGGGARGFIVAARWCVGVALARSCQPAGSRPALRGDGGGDRGGGPPLLQNPQFHL